MRLRSQYIASIVIFGILLTIISASVVVTNQQVAWINNQEQMVGNIQNGASNLAYISNDYFLYQQSAQLSQWQNQFSSLSNDLSKLTPNGPKQQSQINTVSTDLQNLGSVFNSSVSFIESSPRNESIRVLPAFQTDWDRLALQNQALTFDASILSKSFSDQAGQLKQTNNILTLGLIGAFGAYFVALYFTVYRRTLRSIVKLQEGTKIIGAGNLNYSITSTSNDEFGELSQSFNQMTTNLKTVTASKVDLEKEVAERKRAEEALEASEKKANDLIKYAPNGIYELDYRIPPKFKSVNDAMCQILGYTREELLATSPFALLDDESKMRFQERIMKMQAGEKVDETVEFKVIPKDGREIYATLNTTFIYKGGKPDGALVVAHDVTERRKVERELEKRAKNLESLVEERTKALRDSERLAAIGATAGMVGHDIRNPLQTVSGELFLAKGELKNLPEGAVRDSLKESLDVIEEQTVYVNKIVSDLQDYAKPIAPKVEKVDLEKIVQAVLSSINLPESDIAKSVQIEYFISDDFPKLNVDPAYMRRILQNLITNAIQAMPDGGKITIRASRLNGKVKIIVEDTGSGIPLEVRDKLFMPLVTTKAKGQGFGLAVVKRFTEGMGGTVSFESEVGKGTKFRIELPIS